MDLIEDPNLSFDYESLSSSSECESVKDEIGSDFREETYLQHGQYDPNIADIADAKLVNWDDWIRERKKMHRNFKCSLNREPERLVMNSSEGIYQKMRNAKLIEEARTYVRFDKYRGDPKFWKVPDYIYEDGEKTTPINCPAKQKYDRTVIDKNEPPVVGHVGIPQLITYEKGLLDVKSGQSKNEPSAHKCGDYFFDVKMKLKETIDMMETYTPDLGNLYVMGEQFLAKEPKGSENIPYAFIDTEVIVESLDCRGEETGRHPCVDHRVPILKIKGDVIDRETMKNVEEYLNKHIHFCNCHLNRLYSETLVIENVGNVCVRYSWEEKEPRRNPKFPLRYSTQLVRRFYFPTVSGIFIPGQITEIPFWFKSREPGVFREIWKLVLDPPFAAKKHVEIELQGFARAVMQTETLLEIESYIKDRRVTSLAVDTVDSVCVDSALESPIPYDYLFVKRDVFLHKNPDYFYEFEKVRALAELNAQIPGGGEWDYSIKSLRNNILEKVETVEEKRNLLVKTSELSRALLKQNVELDVTDEKYNYAYQVLCSFFNTMGSEADNLRSVYRIGEYDDPPQKESFGSLEERLSIIEEEGSALSMPSGRRSRHSSITKRRTSSKLSVSSQSVLRESITSVAKASPSDDEITAQLKKRTSLYIKTFCLKTYRHLLTSIDEITAAIETLNMFVRRK